MDEAIAHSGISEEVEANIRVTEDEIHRLQIKFATLLLNGASAERLAVLQQFGILQAKLKVLKVRRMYSLEMRR
jgi:hypothetical protein